MEFNTSLVFQKNTVVHCKTFKEAKQLCEFAKNLFSNNSNEKYGSIIYNKPDCFYDDYKKKHLL